MGEMILEQDQAGEKARGASLRLREILVERANAGVGKAGRDG